MDFSLQSLRRFLLYKHGLIGPYRFIGMEGMLSYIRQCGCIQFDPIDRCGINACLVLQSRIKGFTPSLLQKALYQDRTLLDYFDKNLAILPMENWPQYAFLRDEKRREKRSTEEINAISDQVLAFVHEKGYASSAELPFKEQVDWYWNPTTLNRAALEKLYASGDLVIHHKEGKRKVYALSSDMVPTEIFSCPPSFENEYEERKNRLLYRVGAVGLLGMGPSDAYLMLGFKTPERNRAFNELIKEGKIAVVEAEGQSYYIRAEDKPLLQKLASLSLDDPLLSPRMEVLAPLDCMLWDRKLVEKIFSFSYRWEIYTPKEHRKYGYYVLPLLYGDRFIGRIEPVADRRTQTLHIQNVFWEEGFLLNETQQALLEQCMQRLACQNDCKMVSWAQTECTM